MCTLRSMEFSKTLRMWPVATSLALVLAACGGGGNSGSSPGSADGGTEPPGTTGTVARINAGVTGRLTTQFAGSYLETDLASGETRVIRSTNVLRGPFSPVGNTTEFVSTSRTIDGETIDSNDNEAILFFDSQGMTTRRFSRSSGFTGSPLVSPDGNNVLVEWHDTVLEDFIPVPTVFSTGGSILDRYVNYNNQYAWLPDGDVLLGRGNAVYRATPGSLLEPVQVLSLPRRFTDIFASPDGKQLAVTLNGGGDDVSAWVMNVDGSGLRQVAVSSQTRAFAGGFSPDGKQLLVVEGFDFVAASNGGILGSDCPKVHVVPLNAGRTIDLTSDDIFPAIKLRMRSPTSGNVVNEICTRFSLAWR